MARNAGEGLRADHTRPRDAWLLHAIRRRRLRNLSALQRVEDRCRPLTVLDVVLLLLVLVLVLLLQDVEVRLFRGLLVKLLVGN